LPIIAKVSIYTLHVPENSLSQIDISNGDHCG